MIDQNVSINNQVSPPKADPPRVESIKEGQSLKYPNYNLEERTLCFASEVLKLCKKLPKNLENIDLIKQLIRCSSSVGANYREACEALGKKDFYYRLRIVKKEAKESYFFLKLLKVNNSDFLIELDILIQEAIELVKIFSKAVTNQNKKDT